MHALSFFLHFHLIFTFWFLFAFFFFFFLLYLGGLTLPVAELISKIRYAHGKDSVSFYYSDDFFFYSEEGVGFTLPKDIGAFDRSVPALNLSEICLHGGWLGGYARQPTAAASSSSSSSSSQLACAYSTHAVFLLGIVVCPMLSGGGGGGGMFALCSKYFAFD